MTARDPAGDPELESRPSRQGSGSPAAPMRPSLIELMLAFAKVSLSGFGGVLPWVRRMLVEEKRWMTAKEFNNRFAVCHSLPGPNVVNMAAVLGLRLHGVTGSVAAVLALTAPPVALMIGVGMLALLGLRPGSPA